MGDGFHWTSTVPLLTRSLPVSGSGNMVSNDPAKPNQARTAQDVDAPAAHKKEAHGAFHWGRGGEGNVMTVGSNNKDKPKSGKAAGERSNSFTGVIAKGKEILGVNKKKDGVNANEAAVEDD